MKNKFWLIFFGLVLIKSLFWLLITPIFQVPDEPSHFAIVEFMAENKRRPHPRREVVTPIEVLKAAQIVNFNWQISHPVWRGYQPDWREKLLRLPADDRRQVEPNDYQESLKRPAGYYWLAVPFYWLGGGSFLGRFYSVRLLNVLIHLLTVWLAYLIGKKIFRSHWLGLAVASLVAFQPMLSFLSSGVHYDPLAILLSTLFVYLFLIKRWGWGLVTAIGGVLVKPDLIILPFIWLARRFWLGLVIIFAAFLFLAKPVDRLITIAVKYDPILYLTNFNEYAAAARFFSDRVTSGQILTDITNYLAATGQIHLAQVFPWYWGTFGWLEAPLPAWVFSGIKLVILVSVLGWIKFIHRNGWPRMMTFWLVFSLLQAGLVVANDCQFFVRTGEIYGIQGRYFFPAIVAHMMLLVFGLKQWLADQTLAKVVIGLSLALNLIGWLAVYQYFGWVWGS